MNSLMTIRVRVINQGGGALASLRSQVQGVQRTVNQAQPALNRTFGGRAFAGFAGGLEKFGKNLQWTGRQLEFNFTLPIVAAGVAATRWANAFEAGMVKVRKVYGDGTKSAAEYRDMTKELERSFTILSNTFGVHRDEVAQIGAAWAAAGREGVGLAKSVRQTLEVMILGEMDWQQSIEALLSIQQSYNLSVEELHQNLAILNMVENQTAITFAGLIEVVQRAGGAARTAGVDIRTLAAFAASLVPAAGTAAQAGNSLRTIFSRLLAPTKQATDLLGEMGIQVDSAAWQSQNATQRIHTLARAFADLTAPQQAVVSATMASRFQINRFDRIMRDVLDPLGTFQRALDATADSSRNEAQYLRELNTVMQSSPQAWKIMWTQLQNALAQAIIPLIPAIQSLLSYVVRLANAFSRLSPQTQQWIMLGLVALAAVGPIARYVGSFSLLISTIAKGLHFVLGTVFMLLGRFLSLAGLIRNVFSSVFTFIGDTIAGVVGLVGRGIGALVALITGGGTLATLGWVAAIAAAVGVIIYILRNHREAVNRIIDSIKQRFISAWNALPNAVRNAFSSVLRIVALAITKIRDLLSYMNPFARHSPSLVDQVTSGTTEISKQYETAAPGAHVAANAVRSLSSANQQAVTTAGPIVTPNGTAAARAYDQVRQAVADLAAEYAAATRDVGNWSGALARARAVEDQFTAATRGLTAVMQAAENEEKFQTIMQFAPGAVGEARALVAEIARLQGVLDQVTAAVEAQDRVVQQWQSTLDAANRALDTESAKLDHLKDRANSVESALSDAKSVLQDLANTPIAGMQAMDDAIFANEQQVKKLQLQMLKMGDSAGLSADEARDKLSKLAGEIETLTGQRTELIMAGAGSDVLGPLNSQIAQLDNLRQSVTAAVGPAQAMQDELERLQRVGQMLDLQKSLRFDPLTRQIEKLTSDVKEVPFDQLVQQIVTQKGVVDNLTQAWNDANAAVVDQQAVVDQLIAHRDRVQASLDTEKDKYDALRSVQQQVTDQITSMSQAWDSVTTAADNAKAAQEKASQNSTFADAALGDFSQPGGTGDLAAEAGTLTDLQALNDEWQKQIDTVFGSLDFFKPVKEKWNSFTKWWSSTVGPWADKAGDALGKNFFRGGLAGDFVIDHFSGFVKKLTVLSHKLEPLWDGIMTVIKAFPLAPVVNFLEMIGGAVVDLVSQIVEEFKQWGPVWDGFVKVIQKWGPVVLQLIQGVLLVIAAIWRVFWPVLTHTLKPILDLVIALIRAALGIIRGLLEFIFGLLSGDFSDMAQGIRDVLAGLWDAIYAIFKGAFGVVIGIVRGIIEGIVSIFQWLYDTLVGHSIIPDLINTIIFLWNLLIAPIKFVLETILMIVQAVWSAIGTAISFAWNTVIKPVFGFLWGGVQEIGKWMEWLRDKVMRPIWNTITSIISAAWEKGIKPIFNGIKNFLETTLGGAFNGLKTVVEGAWNGIKSITETVWGAITRVLRGMVNTAIDIINAIIGGIQAIANAIPGVDIKISKIQKLAEGGTIDKAYHSGGSTFMAQGGAFVPGFGVVPARGVGGGFATRTPTAIVGEGSKTHPEYVIPTDPRYRNRAMLLAQSLLGVLGGGRATHRTLAQAANGGVPAYGLGFPNPLDVGKKLISGAGGVIGDVAGWVREHGAKALAAPFFAIADGLLGAIPDSFIKDMLVSVKNKVYDWITGADGDIKGAIDQASAAGGTGAAGPAAPTGTRLAGGYGVVLRTLDALGVPYRVTSTTGGTHTAGSLHYVGRAVDLGDPAGPRANGSPAMRRIFDALANYQLAELFYDPAGYYIKNGQYVLGAIGGHSNHVHAGTFPAATKVFDQGGILPPGYTLAYNGTGQNETVISPDQAKSGRTVNIYGNLEFPNITSGDDAEELIKALEAMVD